MISVKVWQLLDLSPALEKLMELNSKEMLLFTTGLKLKKLIKAVKPELDDFANEHAKLLQKFGEALPEHEGKYKIMDAESYQKYYTQLINLDVELNLNKFELSEFESIKGFPIALINALEPFINLPEETEQPRKKLELIVE